MPVCDMVHSSTGMPSSKHVQKSVAFPGVHFTASTRLSQKPLQAQLPPFPPQATSSHITGTVTQDSKAAASSSHARGLSQPGLLALRTQIANVSRSEVHSPAIE